VGVHLAGEHALELELRDLALEPAGVLLDRGDRAGVGFGLGELEQLARLDDTAVQLLEGADDALELGALAAELLGPLRVLPDGRVLEFAQDLRQALLAALVVKGTPSAPCSAA
jgi:hypothetical protein